MSIKSSVSQLYINVLELVNRLEDRGMFRHEPSFFEKRRSANIMSFLSDIMLENEAATGWQLTPLMACQCWPL